ncbi:MULTISPECIES: hypothetical protein [Nocardia]|uniref:hypothetical protein n=1 Tax=Nocardia TaxID=1817 RepID=UPI000FD78A4B|nr:MULTISPECIES: hypothetical protein [Nocardia]MBF6184866.1 hypothetical protein [Nocardia farcinica]MBF6310710.1 hypothetical protein [Nocardia farcinica]MBF6405470.1 hypothetical protein [Nocardia farcinica]UEX24696.1 hypothetical protein LMJ57_09695 [Nocardia farcinica]
MASKAGLLTGYAMAAEPRKMNTYTPERYTLVRRTGSRRRQPIHRYLGRTECLPGSLDEARLSVLGSSDIAIVFAGDARTAYEIELADQLGIPVVPFAATGGARDRWDTGRAAIQDHFSARSGSYGHSPAPRTCLLSQLAGPQNGGRPRHHGRTRLEHRHDRHRAKPSHVLAPAAVIEHSRRRTGTRTSHQRLCALPYWRP